MKIRKYEPTDRFDVARIWSAAFLAGRDLDPEQPDLRENSPIFVAELDGQVAGCFRVHKMQQRCGPKVISSGGIAAVGVAPEKRHLGVGKAMMKWGLEYLKSEGVPFACLYAFSESYYRKLGYEQVGLKFRISCKADRLPEAKTELPGLEIHASDYPKLQNCYNSFAEHYNGMVVRDEWWWERAVRARSNDRHIYAFGDPVEAYAIVKFSEDFWVEQEIDEMVWSTARGYQALMTLFGNIGINRSAISWVEPGGGPFAQAHFDNFAKLELMRHIMYRVVDPVSALQAVHTQSSGEFTIEIEDESIPENRGPFLVCFEGPKIHVSAAKSADITISERGLAQAILGQPSFETSLRNGVATAQSKSAAECAKNFFGSHEAYCLDFF